MKRQQSCDYMSAAKRRGTNRQRPAASEHTAVPPSASTATNAGTPTAVSAAGSVPAGRTSSGQGAARNGSHDADADADADADGEYNASSGDDTRRYDADDLARGGGSAASGNGGMVTRHSHLQVHLRGQDANTMAGGPGSTTAGTSRRGRAVSSNVDLMIAETLQSPRGNASAGAVGERREMHGRSADARFSGANGTGADAGTSRRNAASAVNGYPYGNTLEKSPLAPLPFSGVGVGSGGGSAVPGVPIRPAPDGMGDNTPTSGSTPHRQTQLQQAHDFPPPQQQQRKRTAATSKASGTGARAASTYGPKVVACNFCRGVFSFSHIS